MEPMISCFNHEMACPHARVLQCKLMVRAWLTGWLAAAEPTNWVAAQQAEQIWPPLQAANKAPLKKANPAAPDKPRSPPPVQVARSNWHPLPEEIRKAHKANSPAKARDRASNQVKSGASKLARARDNSRAKVKGRQKENSPGKARERDKDRGSNLAKDNNPGRGKDKARDRGNKPDNNLGKANPNKEASRASNLALEAMLRIAERGVRNS